MKVKPDLKLVGIARVDGAELACSECGNAFSLEIHKHGLREVSPAWISCLSCGKGEDSQVVTNGLVDEVLAGWLKRQKDPDRDVFTAEWRGIVMTGELYPTLDIHQAIGAAKTVKEGIDEVVAPEVKGWWRSKKKAVKADLKSKRRAVTDAAKGKARETAGAAKATAITAAWNLQTGGAGPTTSVKPKRQRCTVKGCRGGKVTISTRVHSATGKTREMKIPCGVCHRSSI